MSERNGRTALVTGATGDIGRAVALELLRGGARPVLVARSPERAAELVEELAGGPLAAAEVIALDVADGAAVAGSLRGRPVDVLVHAAAAHAPYGRVDAVATEHAERALAVSLHGALHLARAVVPGMRARGFGRVVFVSSATAALGGAGQAAYAAAKAGLVGLARSLACEAGRDGVTVNVVAPGLVDTARVRGAMGAAAREALVRDSAVGRVGTPREVAAAVGFLCGADASFVTGAVLAVDGGLRLGLGLGRAAAGEEGR